MARRSRQNQGAPVWSYGAGVNGNVDPLGQELILDGLIAGSNGLKSVPSSDVPATGNRNSFGHILEFRRIEWPIKSDFGLGRACGPGKHWLCGVSACIRNLVEFPLALGAAAPVGRAAVDRDDQVALRRDAGIDGQHVQAGEQLVLGDVAGRRLDQLGAVELAARVAGRPGRRRPTTRGRRSGRR